ncbi:hypothetical protein JCM1841_004046 [Sporobolomyces salmonicolor]
MKRIDEDLDFYNPCDLDGLANLMLNAMEYCQHRRPLTALETLETIALPSGDDCDGGDRSVQVNVWSGSRVERSSAGYSDSGLDLAPLLPHGRTNQDHDHFYHWVPISNSFGLSDSSNVLSLRPSAALFFALDRIVHSTKPRPTDLFMLRMLVEMESHSVTHGNSEYWLDPEGWEMLVVEVFLELENYGLFVNAVASKLNEKEIESGPEWGAACRDVKIVTIRNKWVQTKAKILNFIHVANVSDLYKSTRSRSRSRSPHPGVKLDLSLNPIEGSRRPSRPRTFAPLIAPSPYDPQSRRSRPPLRIPIAPTSTINPFASGGSPCDSPSRLSPFDTRGLQQQSYFPMAVVAAAASPHLSLTAAGHRPSPFGSSLSPSQSRRPSASPSQSRRPSVSPSQSRRPSLADLSRSWMTGLRRPSIPNPFSSRRPSAVGPSPTTDESADDRRPDGTVQWRRPGW